MSNVLNIEDSLLIIVDIQERLVNALDKDVVVKRAAALTAAAKILSVPILATEQYPKGLGETVPQIKQYFTESTKTFEKTSFSIIKEPEIFEAVKNYGKKQILICGIETHICVHQTAADLLEEGYDVYVVKDACASRNKYEFKQGVERMQENGAKITCLEIVLFEWLKSSKHPNFKEIQNLIK